VYEEFEKPAHVVVVDVVGRHVEFLVLAPSLKTPVLLCGWHAHMYCRLTVH